MTRERAPVGAPGPRWGDLGEPAEAATPALPEAAPPVANPTASPPPETLQGTQYAPGGMRLVGVLIDLVIAAILAFVLFAIVLSVVPIDEEALEAGDPEAEEDLAAVMTVIVVAGLGYTWLLNTIGWSPGKQALGFRVVREDGRPPGIGRGFARTVCLPLSIVPLATGLLWALQDSRGQTWHDKLAGTYVVKVGEPT